MMLKNKGRHRKHVSFNCDGSLEEALLDQAILHKLDQSFLTGEEEETRMVEPMVSALRGCCQCCGKVIFNKAVLSLGVMLLIMSVGVSVLLTDRIMHSMVPGGKGNGSVNEGVVEFARYLTSGGLFGVVVGGCTWLALLMLLYKIPFLYGTGVFYRRHKQIRMVIKLIVLQMLFDTHHLEDHLLKKVREFQSTVHVTDSIMEALSSPEAERIIKKRLDAAFSQPESYYLDVLGLGREQLAPLVRPAVLSLCAESAPLIMSTVTDKNQALSIPRFRAEMDRYLDWRLEELTSDRIGSIMRSLVMRHLGWIAVWGSIIGLLVGIVTQAFKVSIGYNIYQ